MKLYVGNLDGTMTDGDLRTLFASFGAVESTQVLMDRETGQSKNSGYVVMPADQEARAAIAGLNGRAINGQNLKVNELRFKPMSNDRGRPAAAGGRGRPGGRRY